MLSVQPPSCVRSLVSTKDGDLYIEGHFLHARSLTLECCGLKDEVTATSFALSDSSLVSGTQICLFTQTHPDRRRYINIKQGATFKLTSLRYLSFHDNLG
jgi:hypothetical protein